MRLFIGTIFAVLMLTGCSQTSNEDNNLASAPNTPDLATCDAAGLQEFIGQSETAFDTSRLIGPARFIRPDTAVTKDYRIERTNVYIDDNGIITRINCG